MGLFEEITKFKVMLLSITSKRPLEWFILQDTKSLEVETKV